MAVIVSDDFNRANAGTLGANWTTGTSDLSLSIVGNTASTNTAGNNHTNQYTAAAWTGGNDQYAEATVVTCGSSNDGGPICRGAPAAKTYYIAELNATDLVALGSNMTFTVYQVSTGTFTPVGTTTMVISANDVIRCEVVGTAIRGYVNGVLKASGTDSLIGTGKPGLSCWQGAAPTTTFDNWSAGDPATRVPYQPAYGRAPVLAQ